MTHILVVDDETALRKMIVEELEELGHRVTEAGDGRQALAAVRTDPPDLILSDMAMPVMDGMEFLAEHCRPGRAPGAPVVIVSAFSTQADIARARAAGAADYLAKPVDFDALEAIVARLAPETA